MPRYIQEYRITTAGGQITVPTCSKFLGVVKVENYFLILMEVFGNPNVVSDLNIKVFHKDEYIAAESKLLGYCVVGSTVFHFSYTEGLVEDLGGDGGSIAHDESESDITGFGRPSNVPVAFAGGMVEL